MTSQHSTQTRITPKHTGPHVLPNFTLFNRLLRLACKETKHVIIDGPQSINATHLQLITDVLSVRNHLLSHLSKDVLNSVKEGREVYVNLLASGGYEYVVAFLAITAVGAVVVPIYTKLPVSEALYYANKVRAIAVLHSLSCRPQAKELAQQIQLNGNSSFQAFDIYNLILKEPLNRNSLAISSDHYLDPAGAGLVIYTSGTTGPPKAVVLRRSYLNEAALEIQDLYGLQFDDCILHTLPVHHVTGIGANILPFLFAGATIDFQGTLNAQQIWERMKQGGITFFSGVPTLYVRMIRHYENHIKQLPQHAHNEYVQAINKVRIFSSGTAGLASSMQKKWIELRRGRPILTRYGATEFGAVFAAAPDHLDLPHSAVGKQMPGVEVKLSNGDEGEILVRTHLLLDRYFDDEKSTFEARDEDGYFRTGDIGAKRGEYYFLLGRASVDIIKSGGYKIAAPDIEREIHGLPYVDEAMVVGVNDLEYGQRIAAAVVLHNDLEHNGLALTKLRDDLRPLLASYKLPTILRVVPSLPKNPTGKIIKKVLQDQFFPTHGHPDIQIWERNSVRGPKSKI